MRKVAPDASRRGQKQGQGQPRFRLGFGELMPAGPNVFARWLFLQAISLEVPEALIKLMTIDATLDGPLIAWGKQWGFTDDWALRCARTNAARWHEAPESRWRWGAVMVAAWEPLLPPPPKPFDPSMEIAAAWRSRVDAYEAAARAAPGMVKTPEKRGNLDHFVWLALHHVGGWTYAQIASRFQNADGEPNEPAIGRAIQDTANLIGISLRPARGRKSSQAEHP